MLQNVLYVLSETNISIVQYQNMKTSTLVSTQHLHSAWRSVKMHPIQIFYAIFGKFYSICAIPDSERHSTAHVFPPPQSHSTH